MDRQRSSKLAKQGFEHWEAGRLDGAAECYSLAVTAADPDHYATPTFHGEFANVLSALGRDQEALAQFQRALFLEEAQGGPNCSAAAVARYFLCEHYLKVGSPLEVLTLARASEKTPRTQAALLALVEALACADLGDESGAKIAARNALSSASKGQLNAIRERLAPILGRVD